MYSRAGRRGAAALMACAVAVGMLLAGARPAAAVEGGQPAILQFGDSFASGEGGGWKGNSNSSSGNRSGTDMAAYLDGDGRWRYDPYRVYDASPLYNQNDSWADGCHVALDAPINRLKTAIPGEYVAVTNVACSGAHNCYINREDSEWINQHYVPRLNEMVRAIADEKGVGFIDPSEAFVGHRLCEYGTVRGTEAAASSAHAEWVRFVDVHLNASSLWDILKAIAPPSGRWPLDDEEIADALNSQRHLSESFHPNYYGQQALGKCLALYFSDTSGAAKVRCTNGGGQAGTTEQMVLSTLPATPTFTDNPSPDLAIPQDGSWTWRTVSVPASVPPNDYVRLYLDINHTRKGQLKISLVDPLGYGRLVRDCNPDDTGAFADGTWTFDVPIPESTVFPPRDPSGTWKLGIMECTEDSHAGTLRSWNIQMY